MSQNTLFAHGVASGDPYADSVILWSRINPNSIKTTDGGSQDVSWEIATDRHFANIINSGVFETDANRDWTVKVEAGGLNPGQDYFYRFKVNEISSPTGETRTLSLDADQARLAVLSCANFTNTAEFTTYGHVVEVNKTNPFDAALFLGDYIYEYGEGGYVAAESAAASRGFDPDREVISLEDYRQRYAQYHTDENLLALRAAMPLIAIWDDHETANDSYKDGAENHDPNSEGPWSDRVDAAMQAYYEWLPIREPAMRQGSDQGTSDTPLTQGYRSFDFSDVLSLHVLETRLTARDEQLAYGTDPSQVPAIVAAAWTDPSRELIGPRQMAWLSTEMATSPASWQVLGQQVLMQSMAIPAELLLQASDPAVLEKYATPLLKLANGLPLNAEELVLFDERGKIPYNLDAWDGYGVERETILQTAAGLGQSLVSLAGDTHNAWAGVLDAMSSNAANAGDVVGLEFATPGVSSPGLEAYFGSGLEALFTGYTSGLEYADLSRRGFLDITFTNDAVSGSFELLNADNSWSTDLVSSARNDLQLSIDSNVVNDAIRESWRQTSLSESIANFFTRTNTVDHVIGSDRNDLISTFSGDDVLDGGAGDDDLQGNKGNDTMTGGPGADLFRLSKGNDLITDFSILEGDRLGITAGQAYTISQNGNDLVIDRPGFGTTTLQGVKEADFDAATMLINFETKINGTNSRDLLTGGVGRDIIQALDGDDLINGGDGNDDLQGNKGNDTMTGGRGFDRFWLSKGNDLILDFSISDGDYLAMLSGQNYELRDVAGGMEVVRPGYGTTTLLGVNSSQFDVNTMLELV